MIMTLPVSTWTHQWETCLHTPRGIPEGRYAIQRTCHKTHNLVLNPSSKYMISLHILLQWRNNSRRNKTTLSEEFRLWAAKPWELTKLPPLRDSSKMADIHGSPWQPQELPLVRNLLIVGWCQALGMLLYRSASRSGLSRGGDYTSPL